MVETGWFAQVVESMQREAWSCRPALPLPPSPRSGFYTVLQRMAGLYTLHGRQAPAPACCCLDEEMMGDQAATDPPAPVRCSVTL